MANGSTAVAKRDAKEQLETMLASARPKLATVLPKGFTAERMQQLVLYAAAKNPQLFECTQESVLFSVMEASRLGLEIGRTAYLVPFRNKGRLECTFIAGVWGLVELTVRSGHVRDIKAVAVYANEPFRFSEGEDGALEHHRVLDEKKRGALVAAYAVAWLRGGVRTFEVMGKDEIDRIRRRSKSSESGPWSTDYDEMAKKTAIRRLCKRLPQSSEMLVAFESIERAESLGLSPYQEIDGGGAVSQTRQALARINGEEVRAITQGAEPIQQPDGEYAPEAAAKPQRTVNVASEVQIEKLLDLIEHPANAAEKEKVEAAIADGLAHQTAELWITLMERAIADAGGGREQPAQPAGQLPLGDKPAPRAPRTRIED